MINFLHSIADWQKANKKIAIARVIKTWNASPRPVGSILLINEDMEMMGSVSGGCVEGNVVKAAQQTIESGQAQILDYGVSDDDAWSIGLSCGGRIQVLLELLPDATTDLWATLLRCLEHNESCIWATALEGENAYQSSLVSVDGHTIGDLPAGIPESALIAYQERRNQVVETPQGQFFFHVFPRKSQLLIFGAAHLTADLVSLAQFYDFETIVIDPRRIFAEKTQFPVAPDQLINEYPSEVLHQFELDLHTYAVVLSHDPKIDDNALAVLLPSKVAYIGALGSRKTHAKRSVRLLEAGFTQSQIDRISGPVGIDIHAKSPKEIALSIMAEVISVKNQYL